MTEAKRILITRGIEFCAELDKHTSLLTKATDQRDIEYHCDCRFEAKIRLNEICYIASLLNIAPYDNFREQIQREYEESKETIS